MSTTRIATLAVAAIVVILAIFSAGALVEILGAESVMVIQYPNGRLACFIDQGIKPQWWGKVTKYRKQDQFWFSARSDQGKKLDESIQVRFNDGGHAQISGSVSWEMPMVCDNIVALHIRY